MPALTRLWQQIKLYFTPRRIIVLASLPGTLLCYWLTIAGLRFNPLAGFQRMVLGLIILALYFAFWFLIVNFPYTIHQNKKKALDGWRRFAEAKGLSFSPGGCFAMGAYVTGRYKEYPLQLGSVLGLSTRTRVLMSVPASFNDRADSNDQFISLHYYNNSLLLAIRAMEDEDREGYTLLLPVRHAVQHEYFGIRTSTRQVEILLDQLADLLDIYQTTLIFGGEAMPSLEKLADSTVRLRRQLAVQLMRAIGHDTRTRLGKRMAKLVCPHCLVHFDLRSVRATAIEKIIYCGCRDCGQSREYIVPKIVAVLDTTMTTEQLPDEGTLRVNWLMRRKLFDFEAVEIIQATDEEVERFAVQIGNDTAAFRQKRYASINCTLAPGITLSENTRRVLDSLFGQVIYE